MLTVAFLLIFAGFVIQAVQDVREAMHYHRHGYPPKDEDNR